MKSRFSNKWLILFITMLIGLAVAVVLLCDSCNKTTQNTDYQLSIYTRQYLRNIENNGEQINIEVFFEKNGEDRHARLLRSFFSEIQNIASSITVKHSSTEDEESLSYALIYHNENVLKIDIVKHWEYNFVKGLNKLLQKQPQDIAFIEGHGEIEQVYLLDAEAALAESYNVHRGQIVPQIGVLDNFAAIIIAGPQSKFDDIEKLVIDQYIMQGGKVLWLVDGVYLSDEDIKEQGWSASIPNRTNIDDMLYHYGVVIKPQLVQDKSSTIIQLISDKTGMFVSLPNFYTPRITSFDPNCFMTKSLTSIDLHFASPVYPQYNNDSITKKILLTSSNQSRLVGMPEKIEFNTENINFDATTIPLALTLEGRFNSFFQSDVLPTGVNAPARILGNTSVATKMVVIGSSRLFKNDFSGNKNATTILPIGYDKTSNMITSDNRAFLVNIIDWLIENEDLLALKMEKEEE